VLLVHIKILCMMVDVMALRLSPFTVNDQHSVTLIWQ